MYQRKKIPEKMYRLFFKEYNKRGIGKIRENAQKNLKIRQKIGRYNNCILHHCIVFYKSRKLATLWRRDYDQLGIADYGQ